MWSSVVGCVILFGCVMLFAEELIFPPKIFLADWCFVVFSQTSLMDRGGIGKLPIAG